MLIASHLLTCPYCWQRIQITVDLSVPAQEYVEDCSICCQPIVIRYAADGAQLMELEARAENT